MHNYWDKVLESFTWKNIASDLIFLILIICFPFDALSWVVISFLMLRLMAAFLFPLVDIDD